MQNSFFIPNYHIKQDEVDIFQKNGEINGWNHLNGTLKINRRGLFVLIVFFGVCLLSRAQDDWTEVKVLKIISTNRFLVKESKTSEKYMVEIFKTKPIKRTDTLYKEGITFLKDNVLGRNVFFVLENSDVEIKQGTILYECVPNEDYPDNDLPPCLSASSLDYILIKNGYVQNLGNKLFPTQD